MSNQTDRQSYSVAAIEQGTVIDHISAGTAIFLLGMLGLDKHHKRVTVGINLPSPKSLIKDIIKVEGWELSPQETSRIAIFSPLATVNIIQNFLVVKKYQVVIPETVENCICCPNPNCITNHENAHRVFIVQAHRHEIQLHCKYCEKTVHHRDIIRLKAMSDL